MHTHMHTCTHAHIRGPTLNFKKLVMKLCHIFQKNDAFIMLKLSKNYQKMMPKLPTIMILFVGR